MNFHVLTPKRAEEDGYIRLKVLEKGKTALLITLAFSQSSINPIPKLYLIH